MIKRRHVLPPTAQRVFLRTDPDCNADIRNHTIKNLNIFKNCDKETITERIRALNLEWDIERMAEADAAALVILSSFLGLKASRYWFLATGLVGVFLMQHALQGWCPPVSLARKWGIRTEEEINAEKIALKMVRGDFADGFNDTEELLSIAERQ